MASSQEIVQIEEIDKGLKSLNSTLTTTADNYLKLVKTINEGSATININVASTASLAAAQRQTAANTQQLDALGKQLQASEQRLKDTEDARLKTILENRLATQAATRALQDQIKAEQAEEGSLVRMRQKLRDLTAEYDRTGNRTEAAANEIRQLSLAIQNAEFETNRHQRNVGNYADAIAGLPGPIGNAASSLQGLATKLGAFGPLGAWVGGAIISIGAPLTAFFTKSEQGVEMLERKLAGVKAAISVLVGELIKSGSKMAESFDDTEKKGTAFWGFLLGSLNPAWAATGLKMDLAATAAENYTAKLQDLEDIERSLIVPRAEANFKIKEAMLLYNDESKSMESRLVSLESAIALENKTADNEIEIQKNRIANLRDINAEKEKAGQLRDEDDKLLQEAIAKEIELRTESAGRQTKTAKRINTAKEELLKEAEAKTKASLERNIENVEIANKQEIKLINKAHIDGKTSDDQYKTELINNEIKFFNKKATLYKAGSKEYEDIQLQIQAITIKSQDDINKSFEDSIKVFEKAEDDKQKLIDDTLKAKIDADIASVDSSVKTLDEIKKEEKKAADEKRELKEKERDYEVEIASTAINGIFDLGSAKRDEELNALEKERTAKLANAKLTESQKVKINEEYDKKAAAIKTKQAKSDKLQAMFNIALNTAIGATNAASKVITLPLVPFIIALGAVQLALAAAQPIPKFKHGTKYAPEMGIFGEAGRELMIPRSGEMILANKATYFEGSKFKGAKIFSNPETEKMIGLTEHSAGGRQMTDERILQGLMSVEKAIKSKPVNIINSDYKVIGQGTSRHQDIYLSRLTRNN